MITLEVHPEIHAHQQQAHTEFSTCRGCHRSFRTKSEEQISLELCDHCYDNLRHLNEPVVRVHVRARSFRAI